MDDGQLGRIVARRTLQALSADGTTTVLVLELGTPRPAPDKDWICPCRIRGLEDSRVWTLYGIDAFQALSTAMTLLVRQLGHEAEERGWTFSWLDATGLPVDEVTQYIGTIPSA